MLKKIILMLLLFILLAKSAFGLSDYISTAEVLDVENEIIDGKVSSQLLRAKILIGPSKNHIVELKYQRIEYTAYSYYIKKGNKILIKVYLDSDNNIKGSLINFWRVDYLKELGILFLILLVIFGRLKGVRSLASLIFSGYIIIKLLIPLIINGYNAVFSSILCASIIIVVSFILISGLTKKSFVAILGTVGGTLTAGVLSYIYTNLCSITGLADEEVMMLVTTIGIDINFRGLYMSAIIIGTIGVAMDVSMSITSVIFEIKSKSPNISQFELFQSGLKVGKDVMSTMVNTLILAYVGSFMPLLITYITTGTSFLLALNTETIAIEIIRSLCGSIGLIVAIPLTCVIATYSVKGRKYGRTKKCKH